MKKTAIIGLVGLLCITASCKSQQKTDTTSKAQDTTDNRGPRDGKDPFVDMDVNKDGILTKAEAKGPIAKDFDKIDLNNDGVISREEFDKAPKPERREGGRPQR